MIVSCESIVLQSRKQGDTSKIITLYSKNYGKISVIAKGARASKNKFGSSLEPLSCSSTTFYLKPHSDLYLLSKSEIFQKWIRIYNSSEHLTAGFNVIETINITQLNKNPNFELYDLLFDTLNNLNELNDNPTSVVIWFFCRFAEIMGFELYLSKPESDFNILYISIENGTIFGQNHSLDKKYFRMKKELLLKFINISSSELDEVNNYSLASDEFATLNNFFSTYFSFHFDSRFVLKSGNLY
jgi:DNA repair protein RecO (recombination protein O)